MRRHEIELEYHYGKSIDISVVVHELEIAIKVNSLGSLLSLGNPNPNV